MQESCRVTLGYTLIALLATNGLGAVSGMLHFLTHFLVKTCMWIWEEHQVVVTVS